MVSYGFYTDTYLGSILSEKEFPPFATQAEAHLQAIERRYRVECPGGDSRAMAVCAMAETIKAHSRRSGVQSATVGGVSVHYENGSSRSLNEALYQDASVYLDIYRGVG